MKNIYILACIILTIISGCTLLQSKQDKTELTLRSTTQDTIDAAIINGDTIVDHETNPFVSETEWEGVLCKYYDEDDGYTRIQECVFPNATMIQVYDIVKRIDVNLKDTLPQHNFEYTSDIEGCIEVCYKYKSADDLLIELQYQGGVTSIEIRKGSDHAFSKISYSAD